MICAVCGEGVQRIVAGYGLCSRHATSLSSSLVMKVHPSAEDWFREWKREYDTSRGVGRPT